MDEISFQKMLYDIVAGLYEKENNNEKYPYSNHLTYGISMLAAYAVKNNRLEMLAFLHETSFIEMFAAKPVKDWFSGWDEAFLKKISGYSLFKTRALISLEEGHNFHITEDCLDLYGNTECDLFKALEQKQIYLMMKKLSDSDYTSVRRFMAENSICTEKDIRSFKMKCKSPEIDEILGVAYEDVPYGSYYCSFCGWTMQFHSYQARCCSRECTAHNPVREQLKPVETFGTKRLKSGIMRYICLPAKLELEIQKKAEKYGFETVLWPEKDRYDIQITLPDATIWAIDAKTHHNPYTLASDIKTDSAFTSVNASEHLYVVPSKRKSDFPDYCEICNSALFGKSAECITEKMLYQRLRSVKSDDKA